jgi:hypothetical protein
VGGLPDVPELLPVYREEVHLRLPDAVRQSQGVRQSRGALRQVH